MYTCNYTIRIYIYYTRIIREFPAQEQDPPDPKKMPPALQVPFRTSTLTAEVLTDDIKIY